MKIHLWSVGKDHDPQWKKAIDDFTKRISYYYPVEWKLLPSSSKKNAGTDDIKADEAKKILQSLPADALLIALDEHGKQLSSPALANFILQKTNESCRNLVFLIGGAYGLDRSLLQKAQFVWSLSELVFPHQLVRLILSEQIYRACTIIRNEKYHHS